MDISGLTSGYSDYLTQQIDNVQTAKIQSTVSKDYTQATDDELMDVCKQFEAYFLEQVFKQMEKTVLKDEESSGSSTVLVDYFKDSAIAELATQSTENQGLGIAQMLYEQMKRNYNL
ncbi:MAG: rod-binding protein [Lachnospiraceae bacterium]|nr:rod-binding protein [Lachnospiraceae bacterium]